ncbi:MAG: nuclear transport factor 2 family protein [Acidimicrobiales bacterium]
MGEDEDQIRRTLSEYSQRCDDGRFEEWADLFTEDARFVLSGQVTEGRDSIRTLMEAMMPPERRGQHVTSNSLVDVDGDSARVSTDYLFVRPTPEGPTIVAAGRYDDVLARQGHRWRFRERAITMLGAPVAVADD